MTTHGHGAGSDGSGEHPHVDRLAEFTGEALPSDESAQVERHLAGCAACHAKVGELTDVTSVLRSAPAEVPIPADVAARITASIENVADVRAAELTTAHEAAGSGPVAWFRRGLPRALVATASVGVLVFGGYAAVTSISGGGGSDTESVAGDAAEAGRLAGEDAGGDADSGAQDDAAPEEESGGGQAEELDIAAAQPSPSEIKSTMRDIYAADAMLPDDCGRELAIEQGMAVAASASMGDGVLVVLEDSEAGELNGWLVPTCQSKSDQALADVETIPVPSQ